MIHAASRVSPAIRSDGSVGPISRHGRPLFGVRHSRRVFASHNIVVVHAAGNDIPSQDRPRRRVGQRSRVLSGACCNRAAIENILSRSRLVEHSADGTVLNRSPPVFRGTW
jgi:hypothetical protein